MVKLPLRFIVVSLLVLCLATATHAGLLVWYDFNDASNPAAAADRSGSGKNGALVNANYSADGQGHTGNAGDRAVDLGAFNNNAWVDIPSAATGAFSSVTANDKVTISLWINGGTEQPAPQWTFYAGPGRQIGSHTPWSDGTIYYDVAGCCGPTQRINKNEPDASKYKGQWNHYAFVKDGTYTAIYQNGVLFHDSGADAKAALGNITEFFLGAGPDGDRRSYNGLIDDFAVWNEALSAARIADIAAGGVVPEPASGILLVLGLLPVAWHLRRRRAC